MPIVSQDGSSAKWPSLVAIAERFGIALQTVRERSAAEGWVAQQREAEDAWWAVINDGIVRELQQRHASLKREAFLGAAKTLTRAVAILNGQPDSGSLLRTATSIKTGLEAAQRAVVGDPRPGVGVGVQVNVAGAPAVTESSPAAPLWAVLTMSRRAPAPEDDPFDHPSPLPPSLASDRR